MMVRLDGKVLSIRVLGPVTGNFLRVNYVKVDCLRCEGSFRERANFYTGRIMRVVRYDRQR